MRLPPPGAVVKRPCSRTASSENQRKNSAAYVTSPRASAIGLPFSRTISSARWSARASISSKARRSTSERWRGGAAAQESAAACAAAMAASASAIVASATDASSSPVAGSCTAKRPRSSAARQDPSIDSSVRRSSMSEGYTKSGGLRTVDDMKAFVR